jgi:hypothetical protein
MDGLDGLDGQIKYTSPHGPATNVGRVAGTDTGSSGGNDAANAERAGSGSVGGNTPSGLTGGRSQFSHRNAQYLSLGTIVMLSSSDCVNLSSAPHEIQRIAPRAIGQWELIILSR